MPDIYLNIIYILLLLITLLIVIIAFIRGISYPYNVRKDHNYNFDGIGKISTIPFDGKVITVNQNERYNTAFIEIKVRTNLLGYIFRPKVRISNQKYHLDQYFEYRVKGKRLVNLSKSLINQNALYFKFQYCKYVGDNAKLILFDNETYDSGKGLIISPHADDAEIAAYGLYSENKNNFVVTVTAGNSLNIVEGVFKNEIDALKESGKIRVWNSITIPLMAGINPENSINLGYLDGTLEELFKNRNNVDTNISEANSAEIIFYRKANLSRLMDNMKASYSWESIVNDFKHILHYSKPSYIVCTNPILDSHEDHQFITIALLEALRDADFDEIPLLTYTNHYRTKKFKFEYYPDGESNSIIALPPHPDKELFFDSIYSHPLSQNLQNEKYIALDAMNALRELTKELKIRYLSRKLLSVIRHRIFSNLDESYFRRSVRANELFFVINLKKSNIDEVYGRILNYIDSTSN